MKNYRLGCTACADPGIFARGGGGGGGVQAGLPEKIFSPSTYFTVLQWFISNKTIIFQGFRGGPTFFRGVQLFPGGKCYVGEGS